MTMQGTGTPKPGLARRGLTLGKYAPLHRGHQLVIETALREMDEVVVIVYHSPRVTRVPLGVRSGWLRSRRPNKSPPVERVTLNCRWSNGRCPNWATGHSTFYSSKTWAT